MPTISGVHSGFWINWASGKTLGATLTLPANKALILAAFLALFVQTSGGFFWRILCFSLHQIRSTSANQDGLYHQQQALLRNAVNGSNALWELTKVGWAWRSNSRSVLWRSLPLIIITTIHVVCFTIAGLFSSGVITTSDEVLVLSKNCGLPLGFPDAITTRPETINSTQLDILNSVAVLGRWNYGRAAAYSHACYGEEPGPYTSTCRFYVRQQLDSAIDRSAPCPFAPGLCGTPAARFDTGFVHSSRDLGINTPEHDAMLFRRVTTCVPLLAEEKYGSAWEPAENFQGQWPVPGDSLRLYSMGKSFLEFGNVTFVRSNFTKLLAGPYDMQWASAYLHNQNASSYTPIPALNTTDSDVTLIGISSNVKYIGNITDLWFKALNRSLILDLVWTASRDLSVLGCTEQYQFCSPLKRCTPLTGLYATPPAATSLGLSAHQLVMFQMLWWAAWTTALQFEMTLLGSDVLLAKNALWGDTGWSSRLPDRQWELEAFNMHNISLALIQRAVVEYASPTDIEIRPGLRSLQQIVRPTDPEALRVCGIVKIRSVDHTSFSVLGLVLILVLGSGFIVLDFFLARAVGWTQTKTGWRLYKRAEWVDQSTLQLQRQALEGRGIGPWTGTDDDVPVLAGYRQTFSSTTDGGEGRAWSSAMLRGTELGVLWGRSSAQGVTPTRSSEFLLLNQRNEG